MRQREFTAQVGFRQLGREVGELDRVGIHIRQQHPMDLQRAVFHGQQSGRAGQVEGLEQHAQIFGLQVQLGAPAGPRVGEVVEGNVGVQLQPEAFGLQCFEMRRAVIQVDLERCGQREIGFAAGQGLALQRRGGAHAFQHIALGLGVVGELTTARHVARQGRDRRLQRGRERERHRLVEGERAGVHFQRGEFEALAGARVVPFNARLIDIHAAQRDHPKA